MFENRRLIRQLILELQNVMPVISSLQPSIDQLNSDASTLSTVASQISSALSSAGSLPPGAADAQDVTDTGTALSSAVSNVQAGIAQVQSALAPTVVPTPATNG